MHFSLDTNLSIFERDGKLYTNFKLKKKNVNFGFDEQMKYIQIQHQISWNCFPSSSVHRRGRSGTGTLENAFLTRDCKTDPPFKSENYYT